MGRRRRPFERRLRRSLSSTVARIPYARAVRFYLVLRSVDGTALPNEVVELPQLPQVGTALKPPVSSRACFVTQAFPANIYATGDLRVAGTIFADIMD